MALLKGLAGHDHDHAQATDYVPTWLHGSHKTSAHCSSQPAQGAIMLGELHCDEVHHCLVKGLGSHGMMVGDPGL